MSKRNDFAERVASLCYLIYDGLPKTGKPSRDCEWTLLSAVLLQDVNKDTLQVVSIATGTKSIPTGSACKLGNQVIDNHAEVLARRCFLRFAYSEFLALALGKESTVFVPTGSSVFEYQLRPGLKLHLFSSHTPCGDASIFPKNDDVPLETTTEDIENGSIAAKRPRLDLESGDIYRCPYNESAMRRALHDRLSPLEVAPAMEFHYSSQVFCHSRSQAVKNTTASAVPCASSVMWWLGSDKATYVGVNGYKQGVTRKNIDKPVARLPVCRRELFEQFHRLLLEISRDRLPETLRGDDLQTYSQYKQAAKVYQERKADFHTRLPGWTKKSPKLQSFTIQESM